jgi:protein-serine/threonine kinase
MTDITPLPSPILPEDSPGPWRRGHTRPGSAGSLRNLSEHVEIGDFTVGVPSGSASRATSQKRKKNYSNLVPAAVEGSSVNRKHDPGHIRHRSLSDYIPESAHNIRPRNATLSGTPPKPGEAPADTLLHREEYLAEQRGHVQHHSDPKPQPPVPAQTALPTPPSSNRSVTESDGEEIIREEETFAETLAVRDQKTRKRTYYRPIRPLGQGTFSKVVLATSQAIPPNIPLNENSEATLDPKQLVAIKIVGHGPAGGADEERVGLSLKREVEIMMSISHPSLIHLKSFDINDEEALLVLGYCAGGDLFDLASQHRDQLTPSLVQRIFAELVDAVRYLHKEWIVHRDIKLKSEYSYP